MMSGNKFTFGDVDWTGHTVILPSVCVGHVGQLCVEQLLSKLSSSSLSMEQVHINQHDNLMPVCGLNSNADRGKELIAALEAYVVSEARCVVLQLRSYLIGGSVGRRRFVGDLLNALQMANVKNVIVLTATDNQERNDVQINDVDQFRIVFDNCSDLTKSQLKDLKWKELERRVNKTDSKQHDSVFLPGGGFAKLLLQLGAKFDLSVVLLARFASFGQDAAAASDLFNRLLQWRSELNITAPNEEGQQ